MCISTLRVLAQYYSWQTGWKVSFFVTGERPSQFWPVAIGLLAVAPVFGVTGGDSHSCGSLEYFGICDPYVPGVLVSYGPEVGVVVVSTWPGGPAEKAGVCPGDEITGLNASPGDASTAEQIVKSLVSDSPTSVVLNVNRKGERLQFQIVRMRESTLAELSRQKYLRYQDVDNSKPTLVPIDEKPEEFRALERFRKDLDRQNGFRWFGGVLVPAKTPDAQLKALLEVTSQGETSPRVRGRTSPYPSGTEYGLGLSALVLQDPQQLLVDRVLVGSPAYRTGVLPGDELLQVDGRKVAGLTPAEVRSLLSRGDASIKITLRVRRGTQDFALEATPEPARQLRDSNSRAEIAPHRPGEPGTNDYVLGASVLYAENPRRAAVAGVRYPSPAFDAGLHLGDLLVRVNGKPIDGITRGELSRVLWPSGPSPIALTISRLGRTLTFKIAPVLLSNAEAQIGRRLTERGPVPRGCP